MKSKKRETDRDRERERQHYYSCCRWVVMYLLCVCVMWCFDVFNHSKWTIRFHQWKGEREREREREMPNVQVTIRGGASGEVGAIAFVDTICFIFSGTEWYIWVDVHIDVDHNTTLHHPILFCICCCCWSPSTSKGTLLSFSNPSDTHTHSFVSEYMNICLSCWTTTT